MLYFIVTIILVAIIALAVWGVSMIDEDMKTWKDIDMNKFKIGDKIKAGQGDDYAHRHLTPNKEYVVRSLKDNWVYT